MERSQINKEDTWDLTKIFKSDAEYDKNYQEVLDKIKVIKDMKGHILDDENTLYTYLKTNDELSMALGKIYKYSYLYHYQDTNDIKGKNYKEKAESLLTKVTQELAFTKNELLSTDYETIKKLVKKNAKLEEYAFGLECLYRYKKCTLSEKEEQIIASFETILGTGDDAFGSLDNADVKFADVFQDGKNVPLNHSNYSNFMIDKDRNVRKDAFKKYYAFYEEHKNTLTALYKSQVKEDNLIAKIRNFSSSMEYSLYEDNIDKDVYLNLIKAIHENLDTLYDYLDFRRDFLGYDELHMYDVYVELCNIKSKKYTFEEAKDTILEALKPLGKTYIEDISKMFDNRSIDKYPNEGKRSGAYEWGVYGIAPYVSVNFEGDYTSVSTVIHELGHAMHSYYSDKNQTYTNSGYPIFLAEIASTVNEVLLNEYMIKNAKTNEEKIFYITKFLDEFRATVYRQTQFAEFEYLVHEMDKNEVPLTTEKLYETYYDLNKLYYKNIVNDKEIGYEWSRIPHFYTPFYVYKYATGFSCAIKIANDILNNKAGALENYLAFLKSGGSDYPLNILAKCGIDMRKAEVIDDAVKMFKDRLLMAKKLRKEMINNGSR